MLYATIGGIWFASIVVAFLFGFYLRTIVNRTKQARLEVEALTEQLARRKKKEKEVDSESHFIDMEDAQSVIEWEHKEMLKKLNPEKYEDE